jgi:deazaflavin-dependent oxidoreductase (nitroreductase family)
VHVTICGAGIAGLTLAWWLRRSGDHVVLVEHAPGPRAEGYMIDFAGPGVDVAERMALIPRLRAAQTGNAVLQFVDPRGRARGRLDYDRLAAVVGGGLYTLMRGDLERELRDALGDDVAIRYGTTVDAVDERPDGLDVGLSDGTTVATDLLVGADGVHSRVRDLAVPADPACLRYMGFHTASYVFDDDRLRQRVGRQFLMVTAPGRQVGLYPVHGGRMVAWFVHRTDDPRLPGDPRAALRTHYHGMGPLIDRTLAGCPAGGFYYDQVTQVVLDGWSHGRVTLVGDACQAVSLLAGQGASLAMAGAYVLADELRQAPPATAVHRYEQRMLPAVRAGQRAGRRTADWLVPPTRRRIAVRGLAFFATRRPGGAALAKLTLDAAVTKVALDRPRSTSGDGPPRIGRPRPGRPLKLLFRLPIPLYRAGFGWLLGRRVMLVEHVGRRSGEVRRAVVEVVEHDRGDDSYVIASGFGRTAQWYRNLQARPKATIQVGRRRLHVVAEELPPAAGGDVMARYARRHPLLVRGLGPVLGIPSGTKDYRAVGEGIPFLRLRPVP